MQATRIYKYPLEVEDRQVVRMPQGAEILTVQVQDGVPCLWARVNPNYPMVDRTIFTFGTGHTIPSTDEIYDGLAYIGTYQLLGGQLVFHVFRYTE